AELTQCRMHRGPGVVEAGVIGAADLALAVGIADRRPTCGSRRNEQATTAGDRQRGQKQRGNRSQRQPRICGLHSFPPSSGGGKVYLLVSSGKEQYRQGYSLE